jgi:hypothetical protein
MEHLRRDFIIERDDSRGFVARDEAGAAVAHAATTWEVIRALELLIRATREEVVLASVVVRFRADGRLDLVVTYHRRHLPRSRAGEA